MRFSNAFKLFLINMIDSGRNISKPHAYRDDFYYFIPRFYIGKNGNKIYTLDYDVYKSTNYNTNTHDFNYKKIGEVSW